MVDNLIVLLSSSKIAVHPIEPVIVTAYWPVVGVPLTGVSGTPFLYILTTVLSSSPKVAGTSNTLLIVVVNWLLTTSLVVVWVALVMGVVNLLLIISAIIITYPNNVVISESLKYLLYTLHW